MQLTYLWIWTTIFQFQANPTDITKCEKKFSHLLGPPTNDTSITVHSPYNESGMAPISSETTSTQSRTSPLSRHLPASPCLHSKDDIQADITILDETNQNCDDVASTAHNGTGTVVHSPIITVHSSPDNEEFTALPSQEELIDHSHYLPSLDPDWNIHQWEDMLYQVYSPTHPQLGSSSPIYHDGDNVDNEFKSKLLELFGPPHHK